MSHDEHIEQPHPSEATAKAVNRRLSDRIGPVHVGLVGRLATLIGDAEVRYVSAQFERGTKVNGTIVVFTDDHVFRQTSHTVEDGGVELGVAVVPRSSLVRLSSSGHEEVRRDPFNQRQLVWPWPMLVKLVYRDLPSFTLPLSGQLWGEETDGLQDLLLDLAA